MGRTGQRGHELGSRIIAATLAEDLVRLALALGRVHAGKTVTIHAHESELVVECDDGPRTIRRTTDKPVRNLKANRPQQRGHAAPAQAADRATPQART